MAINTRSRRASAASALLPWRPLLPAPDGAVGEEDRPHLTGVYAALDYGVPQINTRTRRASALRLLRPYMPVFPGPDGTLNEEDRALIVMAYAGSPLLPAEPAGEATVSVGASAVGTINASATASVVVSASGLLATPPAVNTANITISAGASADLLETTDPVLVSVNAAAALTSLATGSVGVTAQCTARGTLVSQATCSVSIIASAAEASGAPAGSGVGQASVQVLAQARGQHSARTAGGVVRAFAQGIGSSSAAATASVAVSVAATGDDGVPDPTSGTASVTILCSAVGSLIAPSQPGTRSPTSKTIDFKSIADYYNARLPRVASYEFSGGRRFYQRDAS